MVGKGYARYGKRWKPGRRMSRNQRKSDMRRGLKGGKEKEMVDKE